MNKHLQQLLVLSIATLFTLSASAGCRMKSVTEIPVETSSGKLLTQGAIYDEPVRVLIDTGATASLIWKPAIDKLGLPLINGPRASVDGPGSESHASSVLVEDLRVATFAARNRRFRVAGDLPTGVDFILAEDQLSRPAAVEFDLAHHAIRTMEPSGCTVAQLPYWTKTYSMADLAAAPRDALAMWVDVLLNGRSVRAQIDSGSPISIVSKSVADSLGLRYVNATGEPVGIGRGSVETWLADVQTFTLGDETIRNTQLRVAQMAQYRTTLRLGSSIPVEAAGEPEMLLGLDFLRAHHVLVDNSGHKILFTYEGGPAFQTAQH
jgi:predicted aspartyl protease